jgi:hypothetical protein
MGKLEKTGKNDGSCNTDRFKAAYIISVTETAIEVTRALPRRDEEQGQS